MSCTGAGQDGVERRVGPEGGPAIGDVLTPENTGRGIGAWGWRQRSLSTYASWAVAVA